MLSSVKKTLLVLEFSQKINKELIDLRCKWCHIQWYDTTLWNKYAYNWSQYILLIRPINYNKLIFSYLIKGDLLIIMAQIIAATQMVVEEKFVSGSNVSPLQAVGWEGLFGFSILWENLIENYFITLISEVVIDSNFNK